MDLPLADTLLYHYMRHLKSRDKRPTDLADLSSAGIRRVLLASTTGLGDAILSSAAIRTARENFPHARIVLFGRKNWLDLFSSDPYIDGTIPYFGKYRRFLSTVGRLKKEQFDLALILHGNDPDIIPLCYLSGAPFIVRVPNDTTRYGFLLSNSGAGGVDYFLSDTHAVRNRLRLFDLMGARISSTRIHLAVDDTARETLEARLSDWGIPSSATLVAAQVFAANPYKVWPIPRHISLANRLLSHFPDLRLVFTGSGKEAPLIDQLIGGIRFMDRVTNSAGRLKLGELAALIKKAGIFFSPDTGPFHMAVALGTPTLGLYGPTEYRLIGALQDLERHRHVQTPRTCEPCVTKKCRDNFCMEQITEDEVFEVFAEMIEALGRSSSKHDAT